MTPEEIHARIARRARRSPLLDLGDYVAASPDLAHVDPLTHYLDHGLWERRPTIARERRWARVAEALATVAPPVPPSAAAMRIALRRAPALAVTLRLDPDADARSRHAAAAVIAALREAGADVDLRPPGPSTPGRREVWLDPPRRAPHDPGASAEVRTALAEAVLVLTGAPHEPAFADLLPQALACAGAVAFAPETCGVLAEAGAPALWIAPEVEAPGADAPPQAWRAALAPEVLDFDPATRGWDERPLEVAAFGLLTERPVASWLGLAEPVAVRRHLVHMPRPRPGRVPGDDLALRFYVGARTKVWLHVQGEEPAAPDWLEVCAAAAAQGALLLTEPGLRHPALDPDAHLFEEAPRRMPALLAWLLDSADGRREAQARARAARAALARAGDRLDTGVRLALFLLGLDRSRA